MCVARAPCGDQVHCSSDCCLTPQGHNVSCSQGLWSASSHIGRQQRVGSFATCATRHKRPATVGVVLTPVRKQRSHRNTASPRLLREHVYVRCDVMHCVCELIISNTFHARRDLASTSLGNAAWMQVSGLTQGGLEKLKSSVPKEGGVYEWGVQTPGGRIWAFYLGRSMSDLRKRFSDYVSWSDSKLIIGPRKELKKMEFFNVLQNLGFKIVFRYLRCIGWILFFRLLKFPFPIQGFASSQILSNTSDACWTALIILSTERTVS